MWQIYGLYGAERLQTVPHKIHSSPRPFCGAASAGKTKRLIHKGRFIVESGTALTFGMIL